VTLKKVYNRSQAKKVKRNATEQYKLVLLQAEDPFGAYVCSAEWDPDIDNMALVEVH
jgi:hypothetical protein